ncbi:hypothetical protein HGA92_01860 [Candidatus Gracilibacteria bacterium]|nr:hypothetical protein [Candidatus Gracilibacteria bacterium]NUJ99475.1 hypothetical protein [Candidatus Gracilibacteria bacterium]
MFGIGEQEEIFTLEEKIDYIYKKAKKDEKRQARRTYYKVTLLLLFIGYLYYAFIIFIPMMKEYVNIFLGGSGNTANMQNIDYQSIITNFTNTLKQQQLENNQINNNSQENNLNSGTSLSGNTVVINETLVNDILKKHLNK